MHFSLLDTLKFCDQTNFCFLLVFETAKVYCNLIQYEFPLEADVILGAFDWPEITKNRMHTAECRLHHFESAT